VVVGLNASKENALLTSSAEADSIDDKAKRPHSCGRSTETLTQHHQRDLAFYRWINAARSWIGDSR
jgi:hypothetical protein